MMDSMPEMDAVTMEQYKEKFTQTNFQEELAGFFPLLHRIMSETNKIDLEDYVQEERTENRDKDGNLISWKDEGEWKKADDKDPKGKVYNLSDKARKETEKTKEAFDIGMGQASHGREPGPDDQFEAWAEAVEQGKLTDYQIELLKKAIARQEQAGQPLQLGPNGKTAWDFFSGAINPDDAEGSSGAEFSDDLKHKLQVAAREFPDTDAMEVFQSWAKEDYPELAVALGMSGEEPAAEPTEPQVDTEQPQEPPATENGDMGNGSQGNPRTDYMMSKEGKGSKDSMIKEIAKLVKSRYNADNENVGPFNGKENIALDVKKQIAEKFGDQAGEQAEGLAMQFMEKLSQRWEEKHGKVGGDGLARLKELIGNLRGKVESIGGDITTNGGHTIQNNIMSAEDEMAEQHGALPGAVKVQPKYPKPEKNPHPVGSDAMRGQQNLAQKKPGLVSAVKDTAKGIASFVKGDEQEKMRRGELDHFQEGDLDRIRKLSGLAK
jgi:hypothetical protein